MCVRHILKEQGVTQMFVLVVMEQPIAQKAELRVLTPELGDPSDYIHICHRHMLPMVMGTAIFASFIFVLFSLCAFLYDLLT